MKQLVSDITGQMVDVNHGFDQIQVMQAQGHEMFSKADEMEKEIRSPETKDLFDRAEAILLAMNATVNCTNGTNATNCTNATDAGGGGEEEVAAAEKAIHEQALSLREHKVVLSKMLHQENAKLAHKKRLEAEAEHRALAILRKQHPFEPLVKLEHQYRTEKVEAQRRAREHHAAEERELLARKRALERKLHPKKFEAEEKAAAERRAKLAHEEAVKKAHKHEMAAALRAKRMAHSTPMVHAKTPAAKLAAEKQAQVARLQNELLHAKENDYKLRKKELAEERKLQSMKQVQEAAPQAHVVSRRESFMKSLASKAAWSNKFLHKVQNEKPLAQTLLGGNGKGGKKASAALSKAKGADPEKLALKELELEQALDDCKKDPSKCAKIEIKTKK